MILSNNVIKMIQKESKNTYSFTIAGENKPFWYNFPWHKLNISSTKRKENNIIINFKAEKQETLSTFLARKKNRISYQDAQNLLLDVGDQIQTLEKANYGIPVINIDDILVINETLFLLINDKNILTSSKGKITIDTPIRKNKFCAPEMCKVHKIPTDISIKAGIFSIAALTSFCLTGLDEKNYKKSLESIWQTPLYWALMRCLDPKPKNRILLLI